MFLIPAALAILAIITLANYLVRANNDTYKRLFDWFLFFLNLPLFLFGVVVLTLPPGELARLQPDVSLAFPNSSGYGLGLMGMAVWGMLVSLRPLRRWMSRWLPLNPTSPVHALALQFSGILAGSTLLTLTQGGLESLAQSAVSAAITDFVVQQLLFVLLSVLGVGFLVRRRLPEIGQRLGLEWPTWAQIRYGLRWIVILVILQWAAGAAWAILSPDQSKLLGGINDILLGNFDTIGEWVIVALGAGLGEELLFRGALQPVLGLWFTSILFAIAHIQYGITPITLLVLFISLILGRIRRQTNTTTAIFVHAGYDFVLGLFFLLATYLEQFVG